MVALKLNGWTIPVEKAQLVLDEVGMKRRAWSGVQRRNLRVRKQAWAITTPSMAVEDALALENMLNCRGEYFPYDTDMFSAKGRYSTLTSPGGSIVTSSPTPKFGVGCLWAQAPSANLLSSNIATGTDTLGNTTGWIKCTLNESYGVTSGGGASTISSDTSLAWQGSRNLLTQTVSGGFYGAKTTVTGLTASTQYTFSMYCFGYLGLQASVVLQVYGSNNSNLATGSANLITSAGWTRISVTFTTPSGVTAVELRMGESLNNAYNWRTDGVMLNAGGTALTWADGGIPGISLAYDISKHVAPRPPNVALNGWFHTPTVGGYHAALGPLSGTYPQVILGYPSTNTVQLSLYDDAGSLTSQTLTQAPSSWQMFTVTLSTAAALARVLVNGVAGLSLALPTTLSLYKLNKLHVGNLAGASFFGGYVDELSYFPYLPSDAMLLARAVATKQQGLQPAFLVEGDFIPGLAINGIASDVKTQAAPRNSTTGAWASNAGKVSFTLAEV